MSNTSNTFNRGDRVIYIPPHAKHALHKDCEIGEVTFCNLQYVFVRFKAGESATACLPTQLIHSQAVKRVDDANNGTQ